MRKSHPAPASKAPVVLAVTRFFSAPAERVFDAWLDPASAGRWLFATPTGRMQRVEIDARSNGKFVIVEKRGRALAGHFGTFEIIERPRRLVFSFATNQQSKPTRVTVGIEPVDAGCKLTLTHELDSQWAKLKQKLQAGWTMILEGLAAEIPGEHGLVISRVIRGKSSKKPKRATD